MPNLTRFQRRVGRLADLVVQLDALEQMGARLSSKAFVAAALRNAGCNAKRIQEIRADLEARRDLLPNIWAFLRQAGRELGTRNYPTPPTKAHRIMATWASPACESERTECKASVLELVALAAVLAAQKAPWPGIGDSIAHEEALAALRAKVQAGFNNLRAATTPSDLIIEPADKVRQAELYAQGWSKSYFKHFTRLDAERTTFDPRSGEDVPVPPVEHRIYLSDVEWPKRLVEFELAERRRAAESPPEPEPEPVNEAGLREAVAEVVAEAMHGTAS